MTGQRNIYGNIGATAAFMAACKLLTTASYHMMALCKS
jgi:hypothetical protein